jgi:hypothetical protein
LEGALRYNLKVLIRVGHGELAREGLVSTRTRIAFSVTLIVIYYNNLIKMIRGLGDYKKEEKKDAKKATNSYAGGEKSGMAI